MPETDTLDSETQEDDDTGSEGGEDQSGSPQGGGRDTASGAPKRAGQSAAKGINNATDKLAAKGSKFLGPEAQAAVEIENKLSKQIKNEELRLAVRIAAGIGPGWPIAIVGIVILIIILIIMMAGGAGGGATQPPPDGAPKLTIAKTGPQEAASGETLAYQISVAYPGTAQDIEVIDKIPEGTTFESAEPAAKYDDATRTATWNLKDIQASPGAILSNINTTLNLRLKATANNAFLVNQAQGTVIGAGINPGGPVSGDIAKFLPNPIPPDPEGIQDLKSSVLEAIRPNREVYEKSSAATGVPWQVFAGIHYREGGAATDTSLVSGRPIGGNEPDVVAGPGCSSDAPRGVDDGIPEPMAGGCGFASMLDSGIYGGTLLKQKVGDNLNGFEDLVKALSRYNGGGNSNCGKGVPYDGCPRLFEGEDDPYALNFFDDKHELMYVIYCADYTKCNPPREDGRPGTATVAKWAAQNPSNLVYAITID